MVVGGSGGGGEGEAKKLERVGGRGNQIQTNERRPSFRDASVTCMRYPAILRNTKSCET